MREMKNSGVEWIGIIPASWKVCKIKNIADSQIENSFIDGDWIESPVIENAGIRYYTTGNIGDGIFKRQGNGYISENTFKALNCKYAFPGDLVISRLNEPYGRSCILPYDEDRCVLAVDIVILRPIVDFNKKYICYLTQTIGYQNAVEDKARGTAMKRISRNNLGNIFLIQPPREEQDKIVSLLDQKCLKVDSLIANQEAQIEKLKAYKQSLITEVVTKGLDPDVPMKDSGVDWIGEIPEGWKLNRLKFIASSNDESLSENEPDDSIIRYVEIGSVTLENGITKVEELKFGDAPSRARRITRKGDVIVSTVRTYLKAIAAINEDNLIVSTGFCVIRPNGIILSKFVEYFAKSNIFSDCVSSNSVGISYPAINASTLMDFSITAPPIDEQKRICEFLDEKCAMVDRLVEIKLSKVEKLNQYRKSLIYEYVTGKKEVIV